NRSPLRMLMAILISASITALAVPAVAGNLEGGVLDTAGHPKPYIRVDFLGAQNRTVFTDKNGWFSVELRDGPYLVRIFERGQQMEFTVDVPSDGKQTFRLNW